VPAVESASVELRPTIDRHWLEEVARDDPVTHAYAVWDLARAPDRVRFVSAVSGGRTDGYLLFWLGHPSATIVHWVGVGEGARALVRALPARPFVAVIPPSVRDLVAGARGPTREQGIRVLRRERGVGPIPLERPDGIRRLVRSDRPAIAAWATRQNDPLVAEYIALDPDADPAWAAFEGDRPVGVVRASVRLPTAWILGGVYVEPDARRAGWGRKLVSAAIRAAEAAGAFAALYVRDDRAAAVRLYDGLGFRTIGHRLWVDAGAGLTP
jgi:GNAT superfamily N-acetyltransferase